MEERVVDYFVVAGLPDENPKLVDEDLCEGLNPNQQNIEPITEITVIFPSLGERVPMGFDCVEHTPSGYPANLNSGSLRSPEVYLCYRRGRDKPPLVDIGVMYDGKERLLHDAEVVLSTPEGRPANVNNTSARTLLTFRRAPENMPCNELVVTDICVIFQNKGEKPPHAFCLIHKNLNKGMMGCDIYLCYKKSMNRPPLLPFKPEVLLRYPPVDRKISPFLAQTATFCLPMCATVECWPKNASQPRPVFSTFVLTVADATEKIYGAAITFYEEYCFEDSLRDDQKEILGYVHASDKLEKALHVNKCICLLSHHPFFDAFKTFLYYLNWMMRNGPHEVPIERYISHILEEVPFPSPSRPHILMQLSATQNILLSHPHDSPLPKSGASFRAMLNNLGTENCLMVILLVLTEQQILIHSLRPDVLTAITEAISVLIFPFRWQCPYIPLCPLGLCGVLQAPVPFLIGVDSRFFDLYEPPSDVTCIDLDTNTITVSEDKRYLLNIKLFPKKPARVLKTTLETIKVILDRMAMMRASAKGRNDASEAMDIDFQQKRRERTIEMEIQESFLRFMTTILKGYRQYLLPITKAPTIGATDASSLFDFQGFLRSRDKTYQKFYSIMCKTQMFIRFIEERSFVSENDASMEFFDECVDKIEADETETVRLLETAEGNQSERTVFVMPPEPVGLPVDTTYTYDGKFNLKEGLFTGLKLKSHSMDRVLQLTEQNTPGSPIARRTKQEIKSAQKVAKNYSEKPHLWAKYLLSTCYSIWFIHLPSYVSVASSKHMALCLAYEMLSRMASCGLHPADEVCYRVVMQLCGLHSQPVIAVKALLNMKRCGMTPNAMTYGYYNKAVLDSEWPSNVSNSSQLMWNKLRNVIIGVAHFKQPIKHRNVVMDTVDESDRISTGSGISLDSQALNRSRPGRVHSSPTTLSPSGLLLSKNDLSTAPPSNGSGKSVSDSEVASGASSRPLPTRISSSSDIGYGSMQDQKTTDADMDITNNSTSSGGGVGLGTDSEFSDKQTKAAKFWGRMGVSLDQWVKSGVSSLASIADSSYSQSGLLFMGGPGYSGDYGGNFLNNRSDYEGEEDDDEIDDLQLPPKNIDVKGVRSRKRLDFGGDDEEGAGTSNKNESHTQRLLRSVSFGNDTQIMSKLKLLKDSMSPSDKKNNFVKASPSPDKSLTSTKSASSDESQQQQQQRRSVSVESGNSLSLEAKINQFYEPLGESRDTSVEKSLSSSREVTPEESDETYQDTIRPGMLTVSKSSAIHIRTKDITNNVPSPSSSLLSSPARTPVVQDDPLGALSEPCSPDDGGGSGRLSVKSASATTTTNNYIQQPPSSSQLVNRDSPKRTFSDGQLGGIGVGEDNLLMPPPEAPKGFHRSSTLPNYGTAVIGVRTSGSNSSSLNSAPSDEKLVGCTGSGPTTSTSLTGFSSNLKNPFSRYSPGRLSLRKAGNSLIESTIGGKKAEALMEGFQSFKSAATVTVKSKLEELKEAVGNNSTPGKSGPFGRYDESRGVDQTDNDFEPEPPSDQWASVSESYLDQLLTTTDRAGSTRASFASVNDFGGSGTGVHESPLSSSRNSLLFVEHFKNSSTTAGGTKNSTGSLSRPVALEINMTTNSLCHNCNSLLFDEEIMAGWTSEDSNLTTRCPHCKKQEVPFLEVSVVDFRHNPMPSTFTNLNSAPSMESVSMSRRTSFINPNATYPTQPANSTGQKKVVPPASSESINNDSSNNSSSSNKPLALLDLTKTTEGNCASSSSEQTPPPSELDPLGVLEEIHRSSRRPSPESENNNAPLPTSTLAETGDAGDSKNPTISISASSATTSGTAPDQTNPIQRTPPIIELEGAASDPIVVPYLSPLVLRKQLENCLAHEGDACLLESKFVDEHPILFWNLVWFFHRSNLPSHIKGLSLQAKSVLPNKLVKKIKTDNNNEMEETEKAPQPSTEEEFEPFSIHPSWDGIGHRNVVVNCFWDNPKFYEQFSIPLYMEWMKMKQREKMKVEEKVEEEKTEEEEKDDATFAQEQNHLSKLINNVLRASQGNTLAQTCPQLLYHYHKQSNPRHYPTYRDILFLSLIAGKDNIEAYGYGMDKEYRDVYSKLRNNDDHESMDIGDMPPSDTALYCRRYFKELLLSNPK